MHAARPPHERDPRPQRMWSWFTVISVEELTEVGRRPIPFLHTFVTVDDRTTPPTVYLEGKEPMVGIVRYGLLIVWYGPELGRPDRPEPPLFSKPVGDHYYLGGKRHYPHSHLMDFLENSGDVLHFYTTHRWHKANIEYYEYDDHAMRYLLVGELSYAQSATRLDKRIAGWVLPKVPAHTEVNFLGPGFVESRATTIGGLKLNALVTITPAGDGTRIYTVLNVDTDWVPRRARRLFDRLSPSPVHDLLGFLFSNAVIDDLSGDYRIWSKRRFTRKPALILPKEEHVLNIRRWVETFYPSDFSYPEVGAREPSSWQTLDQLDNIERGAVHRYHLEGQELVAFRDETGSVVVLDAYCPHHGAHLGYETKVEAGCIRCPFHHFYFDSDGRCKAKNPERKGHYIKHIKMEPKRLRLRGDQVEVWL